MNEVGTSHTVTATVRDSSGNPVPGSTVRFSVQGSVTTSGSCTTDSSGACSFTYAGPQLPGADAITAYADTNGNTVRETGEPLGETTKACMRLHQFLGEVTRRNVPNATGSDDVAFGFEAKSTQTGPRGQCTIVDISPTSNVKVRCIDVTTLVVTGTHATLFGNATVNGAATTYRLDVDDLAEPGRGADTFRIQTASGYTAGGILTRGNIQIRRLTAH